MAIRKMKKLYLLAVRSRKEALLRELVQRGCVEFSEMEGDIQGTGMEGLLKREDTKLMTLRSQYASLTHAVDLLGKYAPVKSKLLSAAPEVAGSVLLDDSGRGKAVGAQDLLHVAQSFADKHERHVLAALVRRDAEKLRLFAEPASDRVSTQIAMAEAEGRLYGTVIFAIATMAAAIIIRP